jgi:tRNA A-37 threonylcarbamoyl transferase component Bud32
VFLAVVVAVGVLTSALFHAGIAESFGADLFRVIQDATPPWLVDLCQRVDIIGSVAFVFVLRVATVAVAAFYSRWRHLVVFLAAMALTDWIVVRILAEERPIPAGVVAQTDRAPFFFPSRPVAALAVTLVGMAFVLVPAGRPRRTALWVSGVLALLYASARVILAADYVLDAAYAVALGVAAPVAAFAAFVPDDVFPVRYSRSGPSAHLDLGGDRGRAIVAAMADQLNLTVGDVKPFGLAGSGGSSPLRMTVEEADGPLHLFAKIYNTRHLRADRWYRVGRTLLYGQLEDEVPMASVRRLVAYEDYALRLLADIGVRAAHTYGIVELTPNGEYMLVTEFFEDSVTLGDAEIDDRVIDDGLELIRTLWDGGLAHRDIKPANLLVKDGHLQLVDVSGLEIRPTPWRQAVDLANMMLTLALQSDPDRVYARANRMFTREEIGEAFAAAEGPAIPTQLKARLKSDRRPILARFRQLAPHSPISIQRWSARRTALLVGTVVPAVVLLWMLVDSMLAGLR